MSRKQKDPLRPLSADEQAFLREVSQARSLPWSHVARAKALLAVSEGHSFTQAAHAVGVKVGDSVAQWVTRFNLEGMEALEPKHGGGPQPQYGVAERQRILREFARTPDRLQDGTATWSVETLKQALRQAEDGLPQVSAYTIWRVLREAGYTWQADRSWCPTGKVLRRRKSGFVEVTDPNALPKKKLIERAYLEGERLGLSVWCTDQAGPYQTKPYAGQSWALSGLPARFPHEYHRQGTAKILTLFHPASGQVRVQGVSTCPNAVLHPWLQQELTEILATLPAQEVRPDWEAWYEGLSLSPTRPKQLPPLRLLLILDNLTGHKSVEFVLWCFAHGIALLYTPLSGSWLNMAESIQAILKQRALAGQHPQTAAEIKRWFEDVATHWNQDPTPFEWKGKRHQRRKRSTRPQHPLKGSAACSRRLVTPWQAKKQKWQVS